MSYPTVPNYAPTDSVWLIPSQIYTVYVVHNTTALYNASNGNDFVDSTNTTGSTIYKAEPYDYRLYTADASQYLLNSTVTGWQSLAVVGPSFPLPLTFPANSVSVSN